MVPHHVWIVLSTAFTLVSTADSAEPAGFLSVRYAASEVCFNAPLPVDWQGLARQHFTQFSLSQPDNALIRSGYREIYGGTSSFSYPAPLPSDIAALNYHLFSESGLTEIRPGQLRGEVRYTLDRSGAILGPPDFLGQVCAQAPADLQDAGFVAVSAQPQTWRSSSVPVDNRRVPARVRIGSQDYPVPETKQTIAEIRSAYVATSSQGTRYLFVRRADDVHCKRMCCTHSYDLFELGPHLSRVAWTAYNCDS